METTDIVERLRAQYPAGGMIPRPLIIEEAAQEIERLRGLLDRYRWRPIAEMHEDHGPCVLMNIEDPGCLDLESNQSLDYDKTKWTHFTPITLLSYEDADRLREAQGVAVGEEEEPAF
jgi:hypothetical protein